MDSTMFGASVVSNQFKEKLTSKLKSDYPKNQHLIEDVVQVAFLRAVRRVDKFASEGHLWEWLRHVSIRGMDDAIRKEKGRRKAVKRTYTTVVSRGHDPYRKLDWKIDLERAIRKVGKDGPMRAALWHHMYEGYSAEDVIEMLPVSERATRTWERHFFEAKASLNKEMRRKGYGRR